MIALVMLGIGLGTVGSTLGMAAILGTFLGHLSWRSESRGGVTTLAWVDQEGGMTVMISLLHTAIGESQGNCQGSVT